MFFSAILFNFVLKRAMGLSTPLYYQIEILCAPFPTIQLEGLQICHVQHPMMHSFFRVVAVYDYWIVVTATEILIGHPSVIQI